MFRYIPALMIIACMDVWAQTNVTVAQGPTPARDQTLTITLADAIQRAKANAPQFHAALTEAGLAREDRVQARAALLPDVGYTTGAIYTEPNGTLSGRFISANAVHEYISQGAVHEGIGLSSIADYRRARAVEALANAKAEIATRGLVVTVVQSFYGAIAAKRKITNAQQAADEAQHFLKISEQLEGGGEVAHSDVVKAQLEANDRNRDLQESTLAEEKARLALAVLIFPNFTRDYQVADDLSVAPSLPELSEAQDLASRNNPELKAAVAAMRASEQEVTSAIGEHLPSLSINYFYGIDATQYATKTDGVNNLGYQVSATLNLPIWNWGATQSRVKQAQLRRDQSRLELSAAQRQAIADLQTLYSEAQLARNQLTLLHQSVDLAQESLRLTAIRYQGGEATILEAVDAQNVLTQARNNFDDGQVRYRVAIANLQTLTGSF
ncbi:MAG TPA: TolC family protein [Terriglobales bacterium]|nr:TolC family protein [Terriglobales bacterium]